LTAAKPDVAPATRRADLAGGNIVRAHPKVLPAQAKVSPADPEAVLANHNVSLAES
jgi:hypothetical protein